MREYRMGQNNNTPDNEWTEARIEQLSALFAGGMSASRIAAELGITRNAVIGKMHRLRLPPRPTGRPPDTNGNANWTAEEIATLKARWKARAQVKMIARELGKSPGAVKGKAKRLGLTRREKVRPRPPQQPLMAPAVYVPDVHYAATGTRKTLLQLGPHDCRWPCGHPHELDFAFCGARQLDGRPYCEAHCAIAYIPTARQSARRTDQEGRVV